MLGDSGVLLVNVPTKDYSASNNVLSRKAGWREDFESVLIGVGLVLSTKTEFVRHIQIPLEYVGGKFLEESKGSED